VTPCRSSQASATPSLICALGWRPLPQQLKEEIVREHERLCLVNQQLGVLEANSRAAQRAAAPGSAEEKTVRLASTQGHRPVGGQGLVNEVFYRRFDNRRQVGGYFGLVGMPTTAGTASATRASAKPAITAPANSPSNSPGCGSNISPTAI